MSDEEIMSEEAFNELIDNLEIIEKLTPYGRKAIKYWVNKLQKENEKERNKNKQLSNSIIKIYKEQDNLQARLDRKRDEIREKDKQIDLSAEFIKNNMSEKKIINEICIKGKCNNEECHEDDLKDCIKQYFEKLVKEKNYET